MRPCIGGGQLGPKVFFYLKKFPSRMGLNIDHMRPKLAPNMTFLSGFAAGHARASVKRVVVVGGGRCQNMLKT